MVSQLLTTGVHVRAQARHPELAGLPPGVEVVRGDLTEAASLEPALDGVDAVFLMWTAPYGAAAAAIHAIAQRAPRIVLLTSPHKTPHPFFQQPNPMRALFQGLERLIEEAPVERTFLRPGIFAANALSWWAPQVRAGEVVRWPCGAAPTAPIHEGDVAAVAVRALLEAGHHGAEYVLTGPASLSQREQVAVIGEVLGRSLRFEEWTPEEARSQLGAPPSVVNMLLDAWTAAMGQPAHLTTTVAELTGRPAKPFSAWVADHRAAFQRPG